MSLFDDAQKIIQPGFDLWDDKLRDPVNISYTFLDMYPSYYRTSILDPATDKINILGDFSINPATITFTLAQIEATRNFMSSGGDIWRGSFSDVANVKFAEQSQTGSGISNSGDITFSRATLTTSGTELGFEYSQNDALGIADKSGIVIDDQNQIFISELGQGGKGLWVLVHEVGHSLGLEDVSDTSLYNSAFDNQKYSIMSFNPYVGYSPGHLQLFDIAAIQEKYGRNYDTRDGDTTYSRDNVLFDSTVSNGAVLYSIWDGGGNDTIDASGFVERVQIDLRQGHFSSVGKYTSGNFVLFDNDSLETSQFDPVTGTLIPDNPDHGNISIAFHAVIENAIGTDDPLGDILIGNAWGNRLEGRGGNDILYGDGVVYDGNTGFIGIDAGDPNDPNRTRPASDDDVLIGGAGNDELYGGRGNDELRPGTGIDTSYGERFFSFLNLDFDTLYLDEYAGGVDIDMFFGRYQGLTPGEGSGEFQGIERFVLGSGSDIFLAAPNSTSFAGYEYFQVDMGGGSDTVIFERDVDLFRGLARGSWGYDVTGADIIAGTVYVRDMDHGASLLRGGINYSYIDSPLTISMTNALSTATDGVFTHSIDTVVSGVIFGSHRGDTVTMDTRSTVTFWSGAGNDIVDVNDSNGGPLNESGRFVYTGGDDIVRDGRFLDRLTFGPQITPASVIVQEININYTINEPFKRAYTFDLLFSIGGLGTLTVTNLVKNMTLHPDGTILTLNGNAPDIWFNNNQTLNNLTYVLQGTAIVDEFGTQRDDDLTGVIYGYAGDDILRVGTAPFGSLVGGPGNDTLYGGASQDRIWGENDNDVLYGYDDVDVLNAGFGDDTAYGGAGNDFIAGEHGNDILYGDEGSDRIWGGYGSDLLSGGGGDDFLFGGAGDDIYVFGAGGGNDRITDTQGFNILRLEGGLTLADLDFSRIGNDLDIRIASGVRIVDFYAGAPTLSRIAFESGGPDFDLTTLLGPPPPPPNTAPVARDDSFTAAFFTQRFVSGNLLADNGAGVDSDPDGDTLTVTAGSFTTASGARVDIAADGSFTWRPVPGFYGADSFDYTLADGRGGTDTGTVTLSAALPAGARTGTADGDWLRGDRNDNVILGLGGDDRITGRKGRDLLLGGDGNDCLDGDKGDDTIAGGRGADNLRGGAGADSFVFARGDLGTGIDRIEDLRIEKGDLLDIRDILAGSYDPLADALADFVKVERHGGRDVLVSVDADGGGDSFAALAVIEGGRALTLDILAAHGALLAA